MNEKVIIKIRSGEQVEAAAPVIISASRSTDIPAFYAKWFINRLHEGYCVWFNPFNRKPLYVSFKNCKVIVFWTKNPRPIMPYLHELDERGIHYYFQYTLNDYDNEHFEPNVQPLAERIETFKELSLLIGKERVIWRFDPLIVTPELTSRQLLIKIWNLGNQLKGLTDKLVFSFVDVNTYRKVQINLVKETNTFTKETVEKAELTQQQINEVVEGLVKCRTRWEEQGWSLQLATCAEKVNLESYKILHNRCIDGELMEHLWGEDLELVYYLHTGKLPEPSLFGDIEIPSTIKNLKDKGQRKTCGCMISKDIGMYNTCNHLCVYCYANTSKELVMKNLSKHSNDSESIIE
jgi:DNA repair photolyase